MAKKAKQEAMFRLLEADEIECRVGSGGNNNSKWCTLLLYKDARVDQRLLDEVVGPYNWKRSHRLIGDRLYCEVSIFNKETGEWVSKEDVGTESNTEREKGQASDAFKRACFNWGIGRELYSAPLTFINLTPNDYKSDGKLRTRFNVAEIDYDENREVNKLIIVDDKKRVRFKMVDGKVERISEPQPQQLKMSPAQELKLKVNYEDAVEDMLMATDRNELLAAWGRHADLHQNEKFKELARVLGAKFNKK